MEHRTNKTEERSILLSRVLTVGFGAALVLCDVFGWWIIRFVCERVIAVNRGLTGAYTLLACLYLCSIPAYILLFSLFGLLKNIETERVFVAENVVLLQRVSGCCAAAALVCLMGAAVYPTLLLITVAALFMALIVRVVKNVFVRAIRMKDELDLTI